MRDLEVIDAEMAREVGAIMANAVYVVALAGPGPDVFDDFLACCQLLGCQPAPVGVSLSEMA